MKQSSQKRPFSPFSDNVGDEKPDGLSTFKQVSGFEEYRISDMDNCEVYYKPSFIAKDTAEEWFFALLALDSWYQPKLKMYGREITQSRKIAAYSNDLKMTLRYSGQTVDMKYEYPAVLKEIQDQVEEQLGVKFNHVMLNLYENGSVYIGNHRDNLENKVIASVSLGAPRTFIMVRDKRSKMGQVSRGKSDPATTTDPSPSSPSSRPQKKRKISNDAVLLKDSKLKGKSVERRSWVLAPGSLVVMQGDTQKYWKHEIPKEPKVKEARISLTFRQLVP